VNSTDSRTSPVLVTHSTKRSSASEPFRVRQGVDARRPQQRLAQPAPPLLGVVEGEADLGEGEVARRAAQVVVDDRPDLRHADRIVEGVVQPARVRPGAAAQPDHAVVLAAVVRLLDHRHVRPPELPHRLLPVPGRRERLDRLPVERQPLGVPVVAGVGPPAEPGQRPDVERVEVQLLGRPGERRGQALRPGLRGLAVDAVDQVDVQHRDGRRPDRAEGPLHLGPALGTPSRSCLGIQEALHSDADPVRPVRGQHRQPIGGGGGRRGLDRQREAGQRRAHDLGGDREQRLQLTGGQIGRGAAAERRPRPAGPVADRLGHP
jgi:hypothetical protein